MQITLIPTLCITLQCIKGGPLVPNMQFFATTVKTRKDFSPSFFVIAYISVLGVIKLFFSSGARFQLKYFLNITDQIRAFLNKIDTDLSMSQDGGS